MGDVGYRSMHQGISHRFFFPIALDFAENEPILYLLSGYYQKLLLPLIDTLRPNHRPLDFHEYHDWRKCAVVGCYCRTTLCRFLQSPPQYLPSSHPRRIQRCFEEEEKTF